MAQEEIDNLVSDPNKLLNDAPQDLTNNTLPDIEVISRTFAPKIRHVSVKARLRWSKFITEIWAKCHKNPADIESWKNLLASSKFILITASRGRGKQKFHNEKLISEHIDQWENGDRGTLWNEAILSKAAKKTNKNMESKRKQSVGKSEGTMLSRPFWKSCKKFRLRRTYTIQ